MQSFRNVAKISALLLCAGLAGCVTRYSDVMQDKFQYLQMNFLTTNAHSGVIDYINKIDNKPVAFSKIVYKLSAHVVNEAVDLNKLEKEDTVTLINTNGPFFSVLEEDTSNRVVNQTNFYLSYRGLLSLRNQWVRPNIVNASFISEIKDISEFPKLSDIKPGAQITYGYTYGNTAQIANLKKAKYTCTVGAEFNASKVNAKFEGGALPLQCTTFDEFGVSTDSSDKVYLEKYGFALTTKHSTTTYTTAFDVSDVQFF